MLFLFFIFVKISKFALLGVMLMYERTSNERKKEKSMENIEKSTAFLLLITSLECSFNVHPYEKKCTAANNFREQLANTLRLLGKHNLIWLTSIRGMFTR